MDLTFQVPMQYCSLQHRTLLHSSHVQVLDLDHKEGWVPKNWCFQIVVLEKTLESPLDCKEIKSVNLKRKSVLNILWKDWCWIWSSNNLTTRCLQTTHWKTPWNWERLKAKEKRAAEDEMVRKHHRFNGHVSEQTPGDSKGQGSLVCYSPWVAKSQTWPSNWLSNNKCFAYVSANNFCWNTDCYC